MQVQLTATDFKIHDHVKKLIKEKFQAQLERLLTHFDPTLPVNLHLSRDKNGVHTITSYLDLPRLGKIVGHHSHLDLVVALKHVREELEKQIKHRENK